MALTVLGGFAALYDFYSWGYDYGHNLDPTAAIQIPGFSYQPPVVGHKTLLNFDAYSYPDCGGWVVIISSLVFFAVWFFERRIKKLKLKAIAKESATKTSESTPVFTNARIAGETVAL